MRHLTIGDLKVALTDLFEKRGDAFERSVAGRIYGPLLKARWDEIKALPEGLTGGHPLAADLARADDIHDRVGSAIWHLCLALERHPDTPAETRQAAERVREAFVPGLNELERSYADEAAVAAQRRERVGELADSMAVIPVPTGGTIAAWVEQFLEQGRVLQDLLEQREAYKSVEPEQRNQAGKLRAATLDLLHRCRMALRDELALPKHQLPDDYEAQVFGYVDELDGLRRPEA